MSLETLEVKEKELIEWLLSHKYFLQGLSKKSSLDYYFKKYTKKFFEEKYPNQLWYQTIYTEKVIRVLNEQLQKM